ncbi:MAG: succinate dehydrogenase, hydrophobic membrane anchor protein [Azospirillaceae bacterium]
MSIRTPIARARNHGSAKTGVHHWWMQRVTAIALVPLVIWFVVSLLSLVGAPHEAFTAWVANPLVAALLIALIVAAFYHGAIGMQVVWEDYIHGHLTRIVVDLVTKGVLTLLGLLAVISILRLAL